MRFAFVTYWRKDNATRKFCGAAMNKRLKAIAVVLVIVFLSGLARAQNKAPQPGDPWPRQFKLTNAVVLVYQPQVESWENDLLSFRAVVSITPNGSKQEILGVIWATARTRADRVSRIVV